jgi:hypothetical protein
VISLTKAIPIITLIGFTLSVYLWLKGHEKGKGLEYFIWGATLSVITMCICLALIILSYLI